MKLKLIDIKEVCNIYNISESTVHRWVKEGRLPKSRKIGSQCSRWLMSDIENHLKETFELEEVA